MRSLFRQFSAGLLLAAAMLLASPAFAASEDQWIADKRGCKVANPFPRPGETITWSGPCKDGYANGQGVLQWFVNGKPDDRYEGNLSMGFAEGHGVLQKADGGKYDGDWKQSMQEGNGRFEAPDGGWYDGQWKSGKPNGTGQFRRPDGKTFMGQWKDGVFEGDVGPDEQEDRDSNDPNRT